MDTDLWRDVQAALTAPRDPDDPDGARARLIATWDRCPPAESALRCVIAHYAADLEPEAADEREWDERALAAWRESDAADWESIGIGDRQAMLPSLHLNLGDDMLRAGDVAGAREHAEQARAHLDALADDGYGRMIRAGVAGFVERCRASTVTGDGGAAAAGG